MAKANPLGLSALENQAHVTSLAMLCSMTQIHTILSLNDVHSHVELSCELWRFLAEHRDPHTLVCDAGDFFEGTLFYQRFGGAPELNLLDTLVDFACPGNHGFGLLRTHAFTSCKVLCLNVLQTDSTPLFQTHHCFQSPLGRVALTGIISRQAFETIPIQERVGLTCVDPMAALTDFLESLPEAVDSVVVMSHSGLAQDIALMPSHPALKLVLSAHCHRPKHMLTRGALTCVKAPHHAEGYVEVSLNPSGFSPQVIPVEPSAQTSLLPKSLSTLRAALDAYTLEANKVVGSWDGMESSANLRVDVTRRMLDVMRRRGPSSVDVGVLNTTCMRAVLAPGDVTARALAEMFPFGNTYVYGTLRVEDYKAAMRVFDCTMPNQILEDHFKSYHLGVQAKEVERDVCVLTTSHLWANVFEPYGGSSPSTWMSVRQCFIEHMLHPRSENDQEHA